MKPCSTPEGVIVSVTASFSTRIEQSSSAQRPRASSSRSLRHHPDGIGHLQLLNARGRHRLGHRGRRSSRPPPRRLLNARGRHRLGHNLLLLHRDRQRDCSTPEGVIVSVTACWPSACRRCRSAQRPRASSSRSHPGGRRGPDLRLLCSTPEGVIVSVTRQARCRRRGGGAAQRPRASSSRSLMRAGFPAPHWTTAQRPRASSSRSRGRDRRGPLDPDLLNARGRHRLGHNGPAIALTEVIDCSTPEGVIVSVTSIAWGVEAAKLYCSTPEGVIVSVTLGGAVGPSPSVRLLNARGRHRLGHAVSPSATIR